MPSVSRVVEVAAPVADVCAFVARYEAWADLFPGYQTHRVVSPAVSVWTVRGDVGMFSRIVDTEVEILPGDPDAGWRFAVRGVTESFAGEGVFRATALDGDRSALSFALALEAGGMVGPMVNALLKTRLPDMLGTFSTALAARIEAEARARR